MVAPIDGHATGDPHDPETCQHCRQIRAEAERASHPYFPSCKNADETQRRLARIVETILSTYEGVEVLPSPVHEIRVRTRSYGSYGGWLYTTFNMETKP